MTMLTINDSGNFPFFTLKKILPLYVNKSREVYANKSREIYVNKSRDIYVNESREIVNIPRNEIGKLFFVLF